MRWDLTAGPDDKDDIVQLPDGLRFVRSEYRPTICVVKSIKLNALRKEMRDPNNWVGLGRQFAYERSLSDYIAAYAVEAAVGHDQNDTILPSNLTASGTPHPPAQASLLLRL